MKESESNEATPFWLACWLPTSYLPWLPRSGGPSLLVHIHLHCPLVHQHCPLSYMHFGCLLYFLKAPARNQEQPREGRRVLAVRCGGCVLLLVYSARHQPAWDWLSGTVAPGCLTWLAGGGWFYATYRTK